MTLQTAPGRPVPEPDEGTGAGGCGIGVLLWVLSAVLAAVVPLALAHHYGALGIPRSDDWSYLATLFRWVDGGGLSFNHWVSMSLVGQLVLAGPLAAVARHDVAAQQVQTAVVGLGGLAALAATGRELRIPRSAILFVVGGICFGPLWGPLTVSFMTDIPAFAVSAVALLLAVAAWRRRTPSTALLVASLLVSFAAFTIRQYAIVPAIAVTVVAAAVAAARGARAQALRWVAGLAGLCIAAVAFQLWWRHIPDGRALAPSLPNVHSLRTVVSGSAGMLRTVALLCLPVLVWIRPGQRLRAAWRAVPGTTVVVAVVTSLWMAVTALRTNPFVGNYLEHNGALGDVALAGRRPDVLPGPMWSVLVVVASVGAVLLVLVCLPWLHSVLRASPHALIRAADPARTLLGVTVAGYGAAYLAAMATGVQVYDRYTIPVAAAVALLLATTPRPHPATQGSRNPVAAAVVLVVVALLGVAYTADSASFDGARWRAATAAVAAGWPARTVNGGFEWLNWQRGDKLPALQPGQRRNREQICVTVRVNPGRVPGKVIATVESTVPGRAPIRLVAYRTGTPCPGVRRSVGR